MITEIERKFLDALLAEDELGAVVRAHLYIENLLDELLRTLLHRPDELDEMSLTYANKVRLAVAAGFSKDFKQMLLALGTIRNRFSHNLDKKIDSEIVKDLHSKLPLKVREGIPAILANYDKSGQVKPFKEHHPKDQFVTLAATLWVVMSEAIKIAKKL